MELDPSSGVSASKDADLGTTVTVQDQATAFYGPFLPMTLFCFILALIQPWPAYRRFLLPFESKFKGAQGSKHAHLARLLVVHLDGLGAFLGSRKSYARHVVKVVVDDARSDEVLQRRCGLLCRLRRRPHRALKIQVHLQRAVERPRPCDISIALCKKNKSLQGNNLRWCRSARGRR